MDSRGSTSGSSNRWAWWLYFVAAAGVATAIGGFLLNTQQLSNDQLSTASTEMRRHRPPRHLQNIWAWDHFDDAPCEQLRSDYDQCEEDYLAYKQEEEECTRLFDAFDACSAPYNNLYRLIRMEGEQGWLEQEEEIYELAFKRHGRPKTSMPLPPVVDWKPYLQFFQEHGASFSQTLPNMIFARDTPLWKKFPDKMEPKLILLKTDQPCTACRCMEEQVEEIEEDDMVLANWKIYVVDQNGRIVGWREFDPCMEQREECVNGAWRGSANLFEAIGGEVKLYLLPGDTQSIQFKLVSTVLRSRFGQRHLLGGNALQTCFCETEVLPVPVIE